jgi:prephenate dehydrogenase/prephenate dehydratase
MLRVATLRPAQSHAAQAARHYAPVAETELYPNITALIEAFSGGRADLLVAPVYNTREGENKTCFNLFRQIKNGFWIDNIVLPVDVSFGVLKPGIAKEDVKIIIGRQEIFRQCEEYIESVLPLVTMMSCQDVEATVAEIRERDDCTVYGVVDSEELLLALGLTIAERDVTPHNRTRYGVFGSEMSVATGYDATALFTIPLDDRVGMLVDILGEFTRRGVNILDMRAENDVRTQKLQIYIEVEGHVRDQIVAEAVKAIENMVIKQPGGLRILGSYPRVDMRTKYIKSFGFIGTGAMSKWFADRLENEGYRVLLSGRSTSLRPEEMISQVDVLVICVPISATVATIREYAPMLGRGKALVLLAGESAATVAAALEFTSEEVEVMLVHNLWGPQATTMKDKNAIIVRTTRSGRFCSEFESFLYKHGTHIFHDTPDKHDLLMGVGQKLPTVISVAMAMTLGDNGITADDIDSHCTLTSLYHILAMARVHSQNPRTYAEIMATYGESRKIVKDFTANLERVVALADNSDIDRLCDLIEDNEEKLSREFLECRMKQAKAVDQVLARII